MKALLMHRDRDFDLEQKLPWNVSALIQDLELNTLLNSMASEDEFLLNIARKVLLSGFQNEVVTLLYRQEVLKDCLKNPSVVRNLYEITVAAIEAEKKHWWLGISKYPAAILNESISLLQMFMEMLRKLRNVGHDNFARFNSEGFLSLFTILQKELSDEYIFSIETHLRELQFPQGTLLSAELGEGNEPVNYVLRKAKIKKQTWLERVFEKGPPAYTFSLADRDETGAKILSEIQGRGINQVANALAQSSEHILSFFNMLRVELAFYVGCLNLYDKLVAKGMPISFPKPEPSRERKHQFVDLYDVCLALSMERKVVSNSVNADGKDLVMITGANQGGKSSFLRSIGLAQLMMQCGLFVGAAAFKAELCPALLTHYKREEDVTMKHGKLDEELARMSQIVDRIEPDSMLLFNESFAATNEREGSEIARQVVSALLEKRIKIFFVTHLYEFAHGFFERRMKETMFLLAERKADGTRTFRLVEGEPLETSFGKDLYREVFSAGA